MRVSGDVGGDNERLAVLGGEGGGMDSREQQGADFGHFLSSAHDGGLSCARAPTDSRAVTARGRNLASMMPLFSNENKNIKN